MGSRGNLRGRPLQLLSDESGIALILALSVMLVLTVLVTSALAFTSADSRDASRGTAVQKSYAAAEAGINDALAAVQLAGSDTTKLSAQPTSATSGGTVTTLPAGCTSNCVTVRWGGSYNAASQTWTLKAISSVPNPTGAGAAALTRTLTQTATITPPPYSFVALNTSCDNHTLLVETGGQLTVTNAMYIDSCNSPQDAFDIFGAGGNITDPAGITVVGGWETHDGSTVTVKGTQCPLSNSTTPLTATQPAGCPVTGQPVLADPLASKLTSSPTLGSPACTGGATTQGVAYNPAVTLSTGPGGLSATATSVAVQWSSGSDPIAVNDVILVDSEQMKVTAITPGSGPGGSTKATLTVTRAQNGTTGATHANGASVTKAVTGVSGTASNPAPCVYTSGTVTLHPGTYYGGICIGSNSASGCDGGNCATGGATSAYNPAVSLNTGGPGTSISATTTSVPVKWTSGTDPVAVNDVIIVESEQMLVTAITAVSSTTATLTVTRAYNGTTGATHSNGKAVSKVTPASHVDATMVDGRYIIAGGGLRVCGSSTLSAPHVLIYNTQDPSNTSGYGALDQFELNTTGSVNIGPPADGPYEGLTYWQDKNLALDAADDCNHRNNHSQSSQAQISTYDIALESAASTGANGSLGSISGSMYAPANRADFVDELSGTANLAVLSSCILIDGGNSTFAFNPTGLFGSNWVLGPQAG